MLPEVTELDEYRAIYRREDIWDPVLEEICLRHGLPPGSARRGPDGTHIVYMAGESLVIKLFVPLFPSDYLAERLVTRHVAGRLGVDTPTIIEDGEVEGWQYLVMSAVRGRPVGEVWGELGRDDRLRIVRQVGETMARFRSLPTDGLEELAIDWSEFVRGQVATVVDRHSDPAVPARLLDGMAGYLAESPLFETGFRPVLLHADITDEHVCVARENGRWTMTGLVDFGDSLVGHPDYESVSPGLDFSRGDGELLRTLLGASGTPEDDLTADLRHRLMAYTLVHQYVKLKDVLALVPASSGANGIDELAEILWPVV